MQKKYFTTPIYYVNGGPHIGHCYTVILTDVITRNAAMQGFEVRMQTGTDEHGNKVEQAAKTADVENTLDFCTQVSGQFRALMLATNLCCTYNKFDAGENFCASENKDFSGGNNFIRTTDEKHKKSVQELWNKLHQNGWIYKGSYQGWYAMRDEAFYDESEVVDGKAPSGAPVEWKEEEAYFFKLSAFQKVLIEFYEGEGRAHLPDFVRHEIVSFMAGKRDENGNFAAGHLRDLCISRVGLNWGIRVPGDEKHAVYVWLDALQNYISALGDEKAIWWDDAECKTHVIGKDIVRFHAIYWPAFLLGSVYKELPEKIDPKLIPNFVVHGWWLNNGEKMSKSLNNSLDPYAEIEFIKNAVDLNIKGIKTETLDQLALDYFRYFLIKAMPAGSDGNYSRERLVEVVNADLVNNVGNLANRVFSLIYKSPLEITDFKIDVKSINRELNFDFLHQASLANAKIESLAPWNMIKNGQKTEFDKLMLEMLVEIYQIALQIRPIVPFVSESILGYMGIPKDKRHFNVENQGEVVLKVVQNPADHAPYPIVPRMDMLLSSATL